MSFFLSLLTAPLSLLWYAVAVLRGRLFDGGILHSESFDIPTICVGNLAVGGTGKTPHVEYILKLLHGHGYRVAMLSRGYGRKTRGYVLADDSHTAAEIGDEPFQIRRNCPFATVAVCEKRVEGIRQLLRLQPRPEVIVLDDAYQHRYVKAGFNVLLTDASRLYTHDRLLPWGRLREPASAASRAHVIVVTKCREGQRPVLEVAPGQSLYYSQICYAPNYPIDGALPRIPLSYAGRRVLLIAGIANPEPLAEYVRHQGAEEVRVLSFPDHHDFDASDYGRIHQVWKQFASTLSDGLAPMALTTQKDASRFLYRLQYLQDDLRSNLYVQPISVSLTPSEIGQQPFNLKIIDYVSKNSRDSRVD